MPPGGKCGRLRRRHRLELVLPKRDPPLTLGVPRIHAFRGIPIEHVTAIRLASRSPGAGVLRRYSGYPTELHDITH